MMIESASLIILLNAARLNNFLIFSLERHRLMPVTYEVNDGLASVLIVDDKPQMREVLQKILAAEGYAVDTAAGADDALERIDHSAFDIVLTDLRMPGRDGFELLDHIRERAPEIIVILMTAFGSIDTAVEAIKRGAMDYVSKPFETNEVLLRIRRALQERGLIRRVAALERQVSSQEAARTIIGNSGATERLRRVIQQVAPLDATVLITGETGTGKELVARALHESSPRAKRPFIALDCSALPESLVESELFGHERGAFTGAVEMRVGLFEAAEDGTLFLDEVDSLTLSVQAKLLRALQERVVRRLGGKRVVPVKARIVAAANRDLEAMIESGAFRQDLYFRLAAIPVVAPPLRGATTCRN
jgi:DNA-binding NtrC family response regulator